MCDPVSISIGLGVAGLGLSAYSGIQSSNAAGSAARATAQANQQQQEAQNTAFSARTAAANRQTDAQRAAMSQTTADRNTAANLMRQGQTRALDTQQANLKLENQTAEGLRSQGDARAQDLLAATTEQTQRDAQAQREGQQNLLLDQSQAPEGPTAGDPQSPVTKTALARRMAEASTNVREYGSKVARVSGYDQPMFGVGQSIMDTKTGIMPAQAADTLLRTGAPVRALPAQLEFRNAASEGGAADTLITQRGQGQLDTAGLDFSNATAAANLGQADVNVQSENTRKQATADAAYKQAIAGLFGQLGQLGLYGSGMAGMSAMAPAAATTPTTAPVQYRGP